MLARKLLLAAADSERLERWFRSTRVAMVAVGRFMPGERLEDALDVCRRLNAAGLSTVLSELGEHVANETEAARARDDYMSAIDRIEALGVDAHISVKLTQLGLEIADGMAFEALVDVAAHGERAAVEVWIDMESSAYTDATLRIYGECRDQGVNPGICLQSYLIRTAADLDELLPRNPTIRLVKGAYNEPQLAFRKKSDVDDNYLRLARRLLDNTKETGTRHAFGTHDLTILEQVESMAVDRGLNRKAYEVQMLYGVRREAQQRLAKEGHAVRILVSYGEAWFPWYMRRLAERPANVLFVIKSALTK